VVALVGKTSNEPSHFFPPDGALVDTEGGTEIRKTFEGRCEGKIALEPRGLGGFGYDPIFIDTELDRTFAELSPQEKSSRSHRGKALRAAVEYLEKLFEEATLVNV
jgi:non-canonical purine NTP pyrophosphatase (RdgB/HAM1 family)